MEMITPFALTRQVFAGWRVSALLVSGDAGGGLPAGRLAALGARVTVQDSLAKALHSLLTQGSGEQGAFGLMVIDCDHVGGIATGQQAFDCLARAGLRMPVMLICSTCPEQTFPVGWDAPCHLRAPVSSVALRIGLEGFARSSDAAGDMASVSGCCGPEKGRSRGGAPFRCQCIGDAGVSRDDRG